MKEILLNKRVHSFTMPGVTGTLYGHDKCLKQYDGKDATDLPEASPIRQAYERQQKEKAAA